MTTNQPLTLTARQAAARLGCSTDTLYAKVRDGEWPHTRLTGARNICFTEQQLLDILALGAVSPVQRKQPRRRKAA